MIQFIKGVSLLLLLNTVILYAEMAQEKQALENDVKVFSEYVGYQFAQELKEESDLYDLESIITGIRKYIEGTHSVQACSDEEIEPMLESIECRLSNYQAKVNLEQAERCLKTIREKPSSSTLENGAIVYEVMKEGAGIKLLSSQDTVKIQYAFVDIEGNPVLADVSDSSCTCKLGELLPPLNRAMLGMKEGEQRKIYIHPKLTEGKFGEYPPNSILIVEVRLLEILE